STERTSALILRSESTFPTGKHLPNAGFANGSRPQRQTMQAPRRRFILDLPFTSAIDSANSAPTRMDLPSIVSRIGTNGPSTFCALRRLLVSPLYFTGLSPWHPSCRSAYYLYQR